MIQVELHEQTEALLRDPLLGQNDIDSTIRQLLKAEYLRRLGRYQRTNQTLTQKYAMAFDDFLRERVTEKQGNSWEVEKDAMDWETAIGGIQTMTRKLKALQLVPDG